MIDSSSTIYGTSPAMITVIQDWNQQENTALLAQMFRMRAKVFSDKLGWDVNVRDGLERDRFDDESPVYIVDHDQNGRLSGSCRLLPTTGPTLLSEVFSDTIPNGALLSSPAIWECTRFCVDYAYASKEGRQIVFWSSARLFSAIGKICMAAGVETVLGNFDPMMLKIYARVGCRVEILGSTTKFGQPVHLGAFAVDRALIEQLDLRIDHEFRLSALSFAA